MTPSGNQICFFFIVNIEENKIRRNIFSWVLSNPRTTYPSTKRPPNTYPPTHWLPTQQLTELIIIFGRLDNRNIFVLQNTSTAGKSFNYTSVYYPTNLLVSIKHIRRNQLYLYILSNYVMHNYIVNYIIHYKCIYCLLYSSF